MLFVSLKVKKKQEDFNGKEGFEGCAETKDTSTYPMRSKASKG